MLGNYYILSRIMREFASKATSSHLEKAYSSQPNELCLSFSNEITLHIHALPGHSSIYFKEGDSALPKRNFATFFESVYGKKLTDIHISGTDKHFTLIFEDATIEIRLYDSPNVILKMDGKGYSFKKDKPIIKKELEPTTANSMLGNVLKKEFLYRGCEPDIPLASGAYIYSLSTSRLLLSPILLQHLGDVPCEQFDSANEAAKRVLFYRAKNHEVISKKGKLEHELSGYIAKLDETIRQAEENQYDFTRADRYQEIADSLMAVAYEHGKGLSEIELTISGKTEKVGLDPSTTVFANAEKYYGKARHYRNAKKELISKIESFKKKLGVARSIFDRINIATTESVIEELANEASRHGLLTKSEAKQASAEATFREYTVHGGYTVLVGKNAKQNDELTMHVAGKEDIWLHARHVPGSHVIIRSRSKTDVMPKETIIEAAEIAAYYSDAKSQKVAPVAYTKRKYVRKPRKALPGQVLIEKEEVVLVEPKLPIIQQKEV